MDDSKCGTAVPKPSDPDTRECTRLIGDDEAGGSGIGDSSHGNDGCEQCPGMPMYLWKSNCWAECPSGTYGASDGDGRCQVVSTTTTTITTTTTTTRISTTMPATSRPGKSNQMSQLKDPQSKPADDGTFSAADLCADEAVYTNVASSTVDGVTFCSRLLADGASYEFVMLVKPDLAWGAVGFNSGTKMPGTEVMWLGVENAQATLKYKTASSYDQPVDVAEVPQDATVENVPAGTQARWTRPFKQGELAELTVDTSAYNIMFASKAGAQGSGFTYHNKKEVLSSINLGESAADTGAVPTNQDTTANDSSTARIVGVTLSGLVLLLIVAVVVHRTRKTSTSGNGGMQDDVQAAYGSARVGGGGGGGMQ